jgi:hypothetical protein
LLTFWQRLAGKHPAGKHPAGKGHAAKGLGLIVLLLGLTLAHHPEHLRVSELAVLSTAEGRFLQMRVDLEEGGPLRLRSVVVDGESAVLEHRDAGAYRSVASVVTGVGVQRFGADTPYRIRLHDTVLADKGYGDSLRLSALFEPGYLISQEIRVSTLPLPWLLAGLAAVVGLALWPLLRRVRRQQRAPGDGR